MRSLWQDRAVIAMELCGRCGEIMRSLRQDRAVIAAGFVPP